MTCIQLKFKSLAGLLAAAIIFVACNSNHSSNKVPDTSAIVSTDTSQTTGAVEPSVPPEETAMPNSRSSNSTTTPAAPQSNPTKQVVVNKKVQVIVEPVPVVRPPRVRMDNAGVYEYPEVRPQYPGGNYAIENYINNHIRYPRQDMHNNIQGRTNVSFIVNENGRITDAHIVGRKLGYGLDEEAVRIVSSMPSWKPGTVKGRAVKSRITLPITFKVQA
jgi:TonB family protein